MSSSLAYSMEKRVRPLTRWSVRMAIFVVVAMAVAYSIFAVTWWLNGEDAVSDNWVGWLAGSVLLGSLVLSLAAFVIAVLAMARRERPHLLWLPLWVFPVLAIAVAIIEIFWME